MSEHLLDPIRSVRSIDPRPAKAGKIVINSQIADIGRVATWRIKFYSHMQLYSDRFLCNLGFLAGTEKVKNLGVASLFSIGQVSVSFDFVAIAKTNNEESQ